MDADHCELLEVELDFYYSLTRSIEMTSVIHYTYVKGGIADGGDAFYFAGG